MKLFKHWKMQQQALLIALVAVLGLAAVVSAFFFFQMKQQRLKSIDQQLKTAARMLQATLPEDYHDRITGPNSVSPERFHSIVARNNKLCLDLDLEYLWSVMLVDGTPVFTSSTSPDKNADHQRQASFFEQHSDPKTYETVFRTMKPTYVESNNKWGKVRSVMLPFNDIHGRKYVFAAAKRQDVVNAITPRLTRDALLAFLVLLIPGVLFCIMVSVRMSRPVARLAEAVSNMGVGNYAKELHMEGTYELSLLSQNFNRMQQSISSQFDRLNEAVGNLQEFEQIVNNSPVVVYRLAFTEGWPVEFISETVNQFGYTAASFLSGEVSWHDISHPDDIAPVEEQVMANLKAGKETFHIESRIINRSGEVRRIACWNRFIKTPDGRVSHIRGILEDVTEKHDARMREKKYVERIRALAQELSASEDRERRNFAEAVHEDLGQMLVALNLKFSALKDTRDRARIKELVPQVDTLLQQVIQACKTLTWKLSPPSLYKSDIHAGLQHLARDMKTFFDLNVGIEPPRERIELSEEASALLFKCIKELLVNIVKHAAIKDAGIELYPCDESVQVVVSDLGKGFDPDMLNSENNVGFGLLNMQERIAFVNGSIRIRSTQGMGTRITIDIPWDSV